MSSPITLTDSTGWTRTLTLEEFRAERGYPKELYPAPPKVPATRDNLRLSPPVSCARRCGRRFDWKPAKSLHEKSCSGPAR